MLAAAEAKQRSHNYIGSEHILLALTRDADATVAALWRHVGIAPARVQAQG